MAPGSPRSPRQRRAATPLKELPALDRARHLTAVLNEPQHEKYVERQEFYDDNFARLLKSAGLTATLPPLANTLPDGELMTCCRLVADDRLPDGGPVAWLLLRWEESPFATLLLADTPAP